MKGCPLEPALPDRRKLPSPSRQGWGCGLFFVTSIFQRSGGSELSALLLCVCLYRSIESFGDSAGPAVDPGRLPAGGRRTPRVLPCVAGLCAAPPSGRWATPCGAGICRLSGLASAGVFTLFDCGPTAWPQVTVTFKIKECTWTFPAVNNTLKRV